MVAHVAQALAGVPFSILERPGRGGARVLTNLVRPLLLCWITALAASGCHLIFPYRVVDSGSTDGGAGDEDTAPLLDGTQAPDAGPDRAPSRDKGPAIDGAQQQGWVSVPWAATPGSAPTLRGVWGLGSDEAVAVGDKGTLVRIIRDPANASSWKAVEVQANGCSTRIPPDDFHDVWADPGGSHIFVVGGISDGVSRHAVICRIDNGAWATAGPTEWSNFGPLRAVFGLSGFLQIQEGILAVGDQGWVATWRAHLWDEPTTEVDWQTMSTDLLDVFTVDGTRWYAASTRSTDQSGRVWMNAPGQFMKWEGLAGGASASPLRAIWATDDDHVFVVGDQVALQCSSVNGCSGDSLTTYLTGVWATKPLPLSPAPHLAVAVGSGDPSRCGPSPASPAGPTGQIVELDFSADPAHPKANPMAMPPSPPLCAIWGDSTTMVMYAVGEQGTILRYSPP